MYSLWRLSDRPHNNLSRVGQIVLKLSDVGGGRTGSSMLKFRRNLVNHVGMAE